MGSGIPHCARQRGRLRISRRFWLCRAMDGEDTDTLLRNADTAMYQTKENGRNDFQYYTKEMDAQSHEMRTCGGSLSKCGRSRP